MAEQYASEMIRRLADIVARWASESDEVERKLVAEAREFVARQFNNDGGNLMVGANLQTGMVMIQLPRDMTGHIAFTPDQARHLAGLLNQHAADLTPTPVQVPAQPASVMMLPPPEGCCRICGVDHKPNAPHNAETVFYETRFSLRYKRRGTWADAIAHVPEPERTRLEKKIKALNAWTEPPAGMKPIAEPIDS